MRFNEQRVDDNEVRIATELAQILPCSLMQISRWGVCWVMNWVDLCGRFPGV